MLNSNGPLAFLINLGFAAFYLRFMARHWITFSAGQWYVLPFVIQETMLAWLFLTRRASKETSHNVVDWLVAGVGTFAPLFIIGGGPAWRIGVPLQMAGLSLSITSLAYLGRSFGIVPANRGIAVEGPYTYVRHPMYAGHFLTLTGYYFTYPSPHTFVLVAATLFCLGCRIFTEETLLRRDPIYALYAKLVPWRLVPGVF